MSVSDRIQCPKCNARLALPEKNPSPFIRCGVCNILFQIDVPSRASAFEKPSPVQIEPDGGNQEGPPVYGDETGVDLIGANGNTGRKSGFGRLVFIGLIVFGCYFAVRVFSGPLPKVRSNGFSVNRMSSQKSLANERNAWFRGAQPLTRLNLQNDRNIPLLTSAKRYRVDFGARSLSNRQKMFLSNARQVRSVSYSGEIDRELLELFGRDHLFELDLSSAQLKSQPKLGQSDFKNLVILDLSDTDISPSAFRNIERCKHLRQLKLSRTPLDDRGMRWISRHSGLEVLDIRFTRVTFDGLRNLKMSSLKRLVLTHGVFSTRERSLIKQHNPGLKIEFQ